MNESMLAAVLRQAPDLRDRLCYLVYGGSRSYGTETNESDVDLRGIAFAPVEAVFGLETYEQTILDVPDTVVYALNKYLKLAVKGNPTILEMLHVEPAHVLYADERGEELRAHRDLFLSKRLYRSYGGYAIGSIRKLARKGEPYDAKDAHHLIRLLQMGRELLETGALQVHRPSASELAAIKRGEWPLADVLDYAETLFAEMTAAYERSPLPDEVDRNAVQALAIRLNQSYYCRMA
ncbi:nucleotidyltransferase domain-containing protein [Brevibacillus sp. WF146]|uniref:nucleotidyltransferase domain-containing protein n=1 Tax=Brevibacillus sp. WF146 TaxID=319501 RepID=UPI0007EDE50F|nr:nucleotidyltransferase domain-containing protein [Brevibacillus sp. WF146]UYZ14267.1 nucleotidyltransferase domain-containing protein [Brevibacillus sp. WF146]